MLRFVQSSDWHLNGGLLRIFPQKALEKQLIEIRKPFVYAAENNIRHLMVPGDISDKARLDEDSLIALVGLFMQYAKYIQVHYITGNHDFAHVGKTAVDVLRIFAETGAIPNLHIHSTPEIEEIDGVDVCFMPFPHNELPKNDRNLLIFAHIEEAGALGDNGLPLKSASLKIARDPGDFVFSGHLHTYQALKSRRIVFGGSPYQKTFGEPLPKGFLDCRAKYSGDELKVSHKFIDSRPGFRLENLLIEESSQWETLEKGEHVFYKIQLGEGVVAPKNITRDFPNIVYINGMTYKGRQKIELGDGTLKTDKDIPKITPLTGLVKMLLNFDLSKEEAKKAVGMVKEAIRELNIETEAA